MQYAAQQGDADKPVDTYATRNKCTVFPIFSVKLEYLKFTYIHKRICNNDEDRVDEESLNLQCSVGM